MMPAVLIVDMLKDSLEAEPGLPITPFARNICPNINRLTEFARNISMPVIFSMDSFLKGDFIFGGKMKERSIRGTSDAEVTDLLIQFPSDIYSPKRRFSAFYKTDMDQILRLHNVDTVAICGISTHWCVLNTALDALANDFRVCILDDCCAAYSAEIHDITIKLYRNNPLYPLFRIMTSADIMQELQSEKLAK
ncbi:MAG: cysteine hydrolase [Deltaproteobacteria bacterium HGW-Deltaproteobacteria-12]|jgi:nicotinamidase-related amidase|nr:MAG: cysteine hydrolase [Deltaproteobacteria bacterium HGW-Deltaproteobacteria-12]